MIEIIAAAVLLICVLYNASLASKYIRKYTELRNQIGESTILTPNLAHWTCTWGGKEITVEEFNALPVYQKVTIKQHGGDTNE